MYNLGLLWLKRIPSVACYFIFKSLQMLRPQNICRWMSRRSIVRHYNQVPPTHMRAWQALQYGEPDAIQLNPNARVPAILKPNDVLVKIHAASVNPLDPMMLGGYGDSIIGVMRGMTYPEQFLNPQVFPLIVGRDFSGTVVGTGGNVKNFKCGDEVWGASSAQLDGSHAEYATISDAYISHKPNNLSHIEASSIPYAALTAWSAICAFGQQTKESLYGKRVLVFGASGGVGTFAVQLFKAWGAEVSATCATDAVEMLLNLGVQNVLDYQVQDVMSELKTSQRFDFVLDCVGMKNLETHLEVLKKWKICKYVTVVSPTLGNADKHGFFPGTMKSLCQIITSTSKSLRNGQSYRWAYFIPNGSVLKTICSMVESKEIVPVIERVYSFDEVPNAYIKVLEGHARGKTVIEIIKSDA